MEQEGEVKGGSAHRHGLDLALRREDEHFLCEEVELEGTQELHRIFLGVRQDLLDLTKPFVQFALVGLAGLVFPVGGITAFGYLVHAVGTDLHLYPFAVSAHDGHV